MNNVDVDTTGAKVLIVDDTPANIEMLRQTLKAEGYRISMAPDGETALKLAPKTRPDLILMDVVMTGINGYETCKKLKQLPETKEIPVIFVTGKSEADDIVKGFKAGGVDYITKPVKHAEVLARVRVHLQVRFLVKQQQEFVRQLNQVNTKLNETVKEVEKASRTKSEFLASMSHEIRTPLNAIIGMTHLALQTELTAKQHDYLKKAHSSGHSLLEIINDILDFSKIEAGKLDIESVNFFLEDVLNNLSDVMVIKAEEKGLEMHFAVSSDMPLFLKGDPLRLSQVLLNLVSNAIKFTESGEVCIRINPAQKFIDNNNQDKILLKFSVIDTGIGLTREQISRLFQSFSQADSSTTRKYGGSGLGLVICKRLVEMMKGEICVESEPGKGSAFIFTAEFGWQKKDTAKHFQPPVKLEGMKILVVDDSETSQQILQAYLESFSFDVTLAGSGREAIRILESASPEDPYKLVLMDWKMPELDGIQTANLIKENDSISLTPTIIMVTAYAREEVMHQAEEAGLDGFLIKPVNPSVLFETIMEAFGHTSRKRKFAPGPKKSDDLNLEKFRGRKILLVEDNLINQQIAAELLGKAGFEVTIANNGLEGVQKIGETGFDAVLMDIQMPEMDGYEATRAIRKWERETSNQQPVTGIPIIAITAHAMAGEKEKCLKAGMNDHISKPINPEKLFATLTKWIKPGEKETEKIAELVIPNGDLKTKEAFTQSKIQDPKPEIPDLPGIDIKSGIRSVAGNRKLYLKLLMEFRDGFADAANEIRGFFENGNLESAQQLAHSLKGVSGNLGAMELFSVVAELEAAIRNGQKEDCSTLLDKCENSLNRALESVKILEKTSSKEKRS